MPSNLAASACVEQTPSNQIEKPVSGIRSSPVQTNGIAHHGDDGYAACGIWRGWALWASRCLLACARKCHAHARTQVYANGLGHLCAAVNQQVVDQPRTD